LFTFVAEEQSTMKVILDIKDNKADFVLELLDSLSFVKSEQISSTKAQFLKELKGSMKEVALSKQGKIKLKSAQQLLDEL
jgi:hypothetical protein